MIGDEWEVVGARAVGESYISFRAIYYIFHHTDIKSLACCSFNFESNTMKIRESAIRYAINI